MGDLTNETEIAVLKSEVLTLKKTVGDHQVHINQLEEENKNLWKRGVYMLGSFITALFAGVIAYFMK